MGATVINTRPDPDGAAFSSQLAQAGLIALASPVMEIVYLKKAVDWENVGALAFTSANGVRALENTLTDAQEAKQVLKLPVFAVGPMTAAAARAAGFETVDAAEGDLASLTSLIAAHLGGQSLSTVILHVAGASRAGDLAAALEQRNITAQRTVLYEARPIPTLSPKADEAIKKARSQARDDLWVVFFSPRSVDLFVGQLARAGMAEAVSGLRAACLSQAVREKAAAHPWKSLLAAPTPASAAMTALIQAAPSVS